MYLGALVHRVPRVGVPEPAHGYRGSVLKAGFAGRCLYGPLGLEHEGVPRPRARPANAPSPHAAVTTSVGPVGPCEWTSDLEMILQPLASCSTTEVSRVGK